MSRRSEEAGEEDGEKREYFSQDVQLTKQVVSEVEIDQEEPVRVIGEERQYEEVS